MEYKHNPYIPTSINYFTSNDALSALDHQTERFGAGENVLSLNQVGGNDLELGQRRDKREAVQVVMAESVQNYDPSMSIDSLLYNQKKNYSEDTNTTEQEIPTTVSTLSPPLASPPTTSTPPTVSVSGSNDWSFPINHQEWRPQNQQQQQFQRPTASRPSSPPPTPTRTILYPQFNHEFQAIKRKMEIQKQRAAAQKDDYPHFHVTYWVFYPYSQGKTMCSISLGPLGRVPIPLLFGVCLGTRKDFGSHIGDWEHMSLSFRGRAEPEVSVLVI